MSVLDEVQATVTRVSERASPWVVGIGSRIRGSGFVLEAGRVVTNAHNLRGDESRTGNGFGLGLAIAGWIASAHGGRLALEDNRPGLRARLTLPASG